jgi:hypothetical protein
MLLFQSMYDVSVYSKTSSPIAYNINMTSLSQCVFNQTEKQNEYFFTVARRYMYT